MIPRYSRPEMTAIWTDESRFRTWLRIELLACEARARAGDIPADAWKTIEKNAAFEVDETVVARVLEIEAEVKHDVIAFLTAVAEKVGPDSRFIHIGMTSSDVLDTTLAVQLRDASALLIDAAERAAAAAKKLAEDHRGTPMMGRSHGIHAEPITFGLKAASWLTELNRAKSRLERARGVISFGKISGAVGTYASIAPEVEAHVCAELGLKPEPVATQVVPRDRHAEFFAHLAVVGATLERIAVEIRHLQRTEVGEAEEKFTKGQKGSSAMPHKRNPILSENLTGLARLLRGYAVSALENVALWHERDISHSSVERVIGPDATVLLHFALHRTAGLLEGLQVYPDKMKQNLEASGGLFNSQAVLLALAGAGMTREDAYRVVQQHAMATFEEGGNFLDRLADDSDVTAHLPREKLEELFKLDRHFRHEDTILRRAFEESE